jgi:hypothetical protein
MNTDIINTIVKNNDINSMNVMEFIKITMEIVEKLKDKKSSEKKLIVISVLEDFIKLHDNYSLSIDIQSLIDNGFISLMIEAFVFASKNKININLKKFNKCCFIC